jgi:alkyl hydroperoxide reductase subunit F
MLDDSLKSQLQQYLGLLRQPIRLIASLDESTTATEMRDLLQTIAGLSDQVSLDLTGQDARQPSFVVARAGQDSGVRFAGLPLGHEFTSLVLALLQAGGHPARETAETLARIKGLSGDLHFETYFSLSCQNCPDVVQALNMMSVINPNIHHVMVDGGVFQDEVTQRKVMSVPSVFLNGELFGVGRMTLEEIVPKLDQGAVAREAKKLAAKDAFDVLIIGGGPAGASAAIYAARKGIKTGIVSERFGGQVMDTMAIENFISVKETEGPKLVMALEEHVKMYNVDIMNLQRAKAIRQNGMLEVELDSGATLKSKAVIIATGARWRELGVPGEQEYRG